MHITEVRISNVRGYGSDIRCVDLDLTRATELPRWVVVAGRNGAGKSTFLQSIALAIAGPSAARSLSDSFAGWIRKGAETASVAVHLRTAEGIDGYRGGGRYPTFDPWVAVQWTVDPDGPEPAVEGFRVGGNWTPARGPWAENPTGWFLAGYGPFRRLSLAPAEATRTMMTRGRPASLASLFHEEATLSESVHWLKQILLRRHEGDKDAEALEELVLLLLNDGLLPETSTVTRVSSEGLWVVTPSGPELPLSSLSDGYRTVAALVLDVLKQLSDTYGPVLVDRTGEGVQVLNEGVVLIDEIDVHLHVSWQQKIGFWMKEHFPNIQFIVTTHSPFICQAADVGGLVRLPAPNEDRDAEVLTGDRFAAVVNGSADDAIITDLFGLDTPLSERAMWLRAMATEHEARIAKGEASKADYEQLSLLRELLPANVSSDVTMALARLNNDLD